MKTEDPKERYAAAFAEFLAEQLSRSMISISELSRRSGISKQLISSIARKTPHHRTNKLVLPSISTVDAIARGLGASAAEARAAAGYAAGELQLAGAEPSVGGEADPFSAALSATIATFRSLPAAERRRLLRVLIISFGDPAELGDRAFEIPTASQSKASKKDFEEVAPLTERASKP